MRHGAHEDLSVYLKCSYARQSVGADRPRPFTLHRLATVATFNRLAEGDTLGLDCWSRRQLINHVVSNDHSVIDRPQPARHDDSAAAGVIQSADLLRQRPAHAKSLEFGAETGAVHVFRIVLERHRRRRFCMDDALTAVRHVFL